MWEGGSHIFPTYDCLYQEINSYTELVPKIENTSTKTLL